MQTSPPLQEPLPPYLRTALEQACQEAERFRGATAPNPPVGSTALDEHGQILSVQAHQKAGTPHAEARVIQDLTERKLLHRLHTLVVTLEPCNHHGRTPPCSEALLKIPSLKKVAFAIADPNPKAVGGAQRLAEAGLEVDNLSQGHLDEKLFIRANELTAPFFHWLKTGRPWVTVKTAWRKTPTGLTMIPPFGHKTFTCASSLRFAHELRKRADAIAIGSGTWLADRPELNVRHVPDHPQKKRWLAILDRCGQVSRANGWEEWAARKSAQGFEVRLTEDFSELLQFLGSKGVLELLVEAGPTFSKALLTGPDWDEHFRIVATDSLPGANLNPEDQIHRELRSRT